MASNAPSIEHNSPTRTTRIKAPGVDNLEDLKKIISALEYVTIPYSYIETQHLDELKKKEKLSSLIYQQIQEWKTRNNFSLGKGYLQPLVSLSSALNIIETVKLENSTLDMPLGTDGPLLNTFITQKTDAELSLISLAKLTHIGHTLCDLSKKTDQHSIRKYDEILFWLFLHGKISHHFNRLIENIGSFSNPGIDVVLRNLETDPSSVRFFLGWIYFFDLEGLNPGNPSIRIFSKIKIAKKILVSTVLELNTRKPGKYTIRDLELQISAGLDLSPTFVNFFNIFQIIVNKLKAKNETKDIMTGTTGSVGETGLPDSPTLNILAIKKEIPVELFLGKFTDDELKSILNVGE